MGSLAPASGGIAGAGAKCRHQRRRLLLGSAVINASRLLDLMGKVLWAVRRDCRICPAYLPVGFATAPNCRNEMLRSSILSEARLKS